MSYTIQLGTGEEQAFESLDISGAKLIEDVTGQSRLEIEVDAAISVDALAEPFQRAVLRVDGAVRFVGWLDQAPRTATGNSSRIAYVFTGPHRWLDRAIFIQSDKGGLCYCGYLGGMTAGKGADGTKDSAPLKDVIVEILDDALEKYGGAFAYTGETVFNWQIPVERRVDLTCWTALRSVLSFAPAASLWWTFGSGGNAIMPVLHFSNASFAASKILSTETHEISQATLTPRYDLLADKITVIFNGETEEDQSIQWAGPGGEALALGANRELVFTFEAGALYNIPEEGIAQAIADWYQHLHVDGNATKLSIDWSDRPGESLGFSGDLTQFAARTTLVNTVARDLIRDVTSLTLGVIPGKNIVPISQRVENTNSAESTGSGGSPDENTGTLHVVISPLDDFPNDDAAWSAGTVSGVGDASPTVPAASYTVVGLPLYDDATGKWWLPSAAQNVTIAKGGSGTATLDYYQADRIKLLKGSGEVQGEIDINIADIPAGAGSNPVVKLVEFDIAVNGALKKTVILSAEAPWDPA